MDASYRRGERWETIFGKNDDLIHMENEQDAELSRTGKLLERQHKLLDEQSHSKDTAYQLWLEN